MNFGTNGMMIGITWFSSLEYDHSWWYTHRTCTPRCTPVKSVIVSGQYGHRKEKMALKLLSGKE